MIPVLIEAAVRAMVVALTVWAGLRILRVRNVPAQKAAWGLVLACAVAMPLVMPMATRWQVLPEWLTVRLPAHALPDHVWSSTPVGESVTAVPVTAEPVSDAAMLSFVDSEPIAAPAVKADAAPRRELHLKSAGGDRFPAPVITSNPGSYTATAEPGDAPTNLPPAAAPIASRWLRFPDTAALAMLATLAYATVCLLLLGRIAFGLSQALELWEKAEIFVPMPSTTGEPDPTLGLSVRFTRAVASPVTIGSGIVLPRECLDWDEQKLRIVLAHERAHVRQGDFYLQLAAELYTAAFWFSPLGWWLKRTLCDLSETISDHAGLEEAASHASYAQVLLEFAALPRPTAIGVAMARSNNLSHRIERLLNESSFRQAFAGSRSRIAAAILLVPVALFAGTEVIRVEAAQSTQAVQAPPPAAPAQPASEAGPVPEAMPAAQDQAAPAPAPAPDAIPAPPTAPAMALPPAPTAAYGEVRDRADAEADADRAEADRAEAAYSAQNRAYATKAAKLAINNASVQSAKAAAVYQRQASNYAKLQSSDDYVRLQSGGHYAMLQSSGQGNSYSYSLNGDSYALVTKPGEKMSFSGDWNGGTHEDIDKARKIAHGKFLWFTHNGKSYIVDDPAIVAQLETMYKPIEDLGAKQEALGKLQEDLGRQQEELGQKQEEAAIPTPDISKEMAELNEAVAKMNAKKGSTITEEQLADLQSKIGEIEGRLGDMQGKIGEKQGELGELQGKLGEKQGKLGEQQGLLGEQEGKLAEQADRKVKSVIDETLHNGKARPVE